MFIENELAGSSGDADAGQAGQPDGWLASRLTSILAICESLELELAEVQGTGAIQIERQNCCDRVEAVRALAEAMLEGGE